MYSTKKHLVGEWQAVRAAFKIDGRKLNARETAGMLTEELGTVTAALRLVQASQDAPFVLELNKPRLGREVREVLFYAWMAEQGDRPQLIKSLIKLYEDQLQLLYVKDCSDAKIWAGMLLKENGEKIRSYIHELGMGLYSPMHFTAGFATNPYARDVLFELEMVLWTEEKKEKDEHFTTKC